jgi:hypothetical protein
MRTQSLINRTAPLMAFQRLIGKSALAVTSVLLTSTVLITPAFAATTPPTITTVAGNGIRGFAGDGGVAVRAQLNNPSGIAKALTGTLYISDSNNNKVRKVSAPKSIGHDIISTFAGNGQPGFAGDGGLATAARLSKPSGIAIDSLGDVFIADTGNNRVREVLANGHIRTVAGSGLCGRTVPLRNGGPATSASLCQPTGVAVDGSSLYISDTGHSEVRIVGPRGVISAFAGTGVRGYSGDGGLATGARLGLPMGLAVNAAHDLLIADSADAVVREVLTTHRIRTFAGTGIAGFAGDGGLATRARLKDPTGVAASPTGNVYIADTLNNRIRQVNSPGVISTLAGTNQSGFSGDGGPANRAMLASPTGTVAADAAAVYFADTGNLRVRGVFNGPPPVLPESHWAILFPLGALAVGGIGLLLVRRRRRMSSPSGLSG